MILRAWFFIVAIAALMPREPDLGFGRPGVQVPLPSDLFAGAAGAIGKVGDACHASHLACTASIDTIDVLRSLALRSLSQVKAEIAADQRARRLPAPPG